MNNDLRYYGNPMKWKSVKGDLISREALKEAIRKRLCISSLKYLTEQEKVIVNEIEIAPTIEQNERPQMMSCSNCKYDNICAVDEPCRYCEMHSEWQAKGGAE